MGNRLPRRLPVRGAGPRHPRYPRRRPLRPGPRWSRSPPKVPPNLRRSPPRRRLRLRSLRSRRRHGPWNPFRRWPKTPARPSPRLERITSEPQPGGGTDIILWGDGAIRAESFTRTRLDGNPPRELVRLSGIRRQFPQTRVTVGTPEVLQVRVGFHPETGGRRASRGARSRAPERGGDGRRARREPSAHPPAKKVAGPAGLRCSRIPSPETALERCKPLESLGNR